MNGRPLAALALIVPVCMSVALQTAHAQADARQLQRRAIARIDAVVDAYRRTGDQRLPVSELTQAEAELAASNRALAAASDWSALALGLTKHGHVHRLQARWAEAVSLYKQALEAALRGKDLVRQADALAWQALAESSRPNLGEAFAAAQRAVSIASSAGDREVLARALDVLATVQIAQGDLTGAVDTIERELIVAATADPLALHFAYYNRFDLYRTLAMRCDHTQNFDACAQAVDRSRSDLLQAAAVARKHGYPGLARQTEEQMQSVEAARVTVELTRKYAATQKQFDIFRPQRANDVLVTDRFVTPPGDDQKQVAAMYRQMKEVEAQGIQVESVRWRTQFTEGHMAEMRGDGAAALASYLQAIETIERDLRSIHDDRSRRTFAEERLSVYYAAVRHQLERRQYADAFATLERSRARSLADLLASRRLGIAESRETDLFVESIQLRTQIAAAQQQLFDLAMQPEVARKSPRRASIETEIRELEQRYREVNARLEVEAPRLNGLVAARPATLAALQSAMRRERFEVLQYLVFDSGVVAWHIGPESVTARNVFLPPEQLTPKVRRLQDSLVDRNVPFDKAMARELFLFLIQPLLAQVRGNRLVIIPHESLSAIPFQVLEDPVDGRALGERFDISYAPSASILLEFKPSVALGTARLYAAADPDIAAAPGEVTAIAGLFPGRSRVVADRLPNEAEVKNGTRDADVVHLSVHGKFNAAEPMLSFIQLAPTGGDDGRLTAAEMFGLQLDDSKLVVLSACETGRVEGTRGNETLGLVRALIYAGASTLVLSHWEVDSEATALWMRAFYETARTRPIAEAVRVASTRLKKTPAYAHPYYWAAFGMVGR